MERSQVAEPIPGSAALRAGYQHEAFLYEGHEEFMQGTLDFILDAVAAAEPVLVVVDSDKIDLLRGELGGNSDEVLFAAASPQVSAAATYTGAEAAL